MGDAANITDETCFDKATGGKQGLFGLFLSINVNNLFLLQC